MLKRILMIAVLALALGAYGIPASAAPEDDLIGSAAPGFSYSDYNGNTVSLSDYSGKLVMVVFWFPT